MVSAHKRGTSKVYLYLVSVLVSFMGIFMPAYIFNMQRGQKEINIVFLAIGLTVCSIVALCLIAFFRFKEKKGLPKEEKYVVSFGRVVATVIVMGCGIMVINVLSGLLAMLLYHFLYEKTSLDQIKGIINCVVSVLTIMTLPFFISIFWAEMKSDKKIWKAFIEGIRINGRRYLLFLTVIILLYVIGILLSIFFHYVTGNIFVEVLKAVLFAVIGIVSIEVTERI